MNSLYGNIITHIPRSNFQILCTYPNVQMMRWNTEEDNVPLYGYVLVDYNHPNENYNQENSTLNLYQFNNKIDQDAFGSDKLIVNYDQTVWQKILDSEGIPFYRAISRINSFLPSYPAGSHFEPKAMLEFQRLNAAPLIKAHIPDSYKDFGEIEQKLQSIKLDAISVEAFNTKSNKIAGENEDIEIFQMDMDADYPSMSSYTTNQYGEQMEKKIEDLNTSISKLNGRLEEAQKNITSHTDSINDELDKIAVEEENISKALENISSIQENIIEKKSNIITAVDGILTTTNNFNNTLESNITVNNEKVSQYVKIQKDYLDIIQTNINDIYNQIKGNESDLFDITGYPDDIKSLVQNLNDNYVNIITELNTKITESCDTLKSDDVSGFIHYINIIQNNIDILLNNITDIRTSLSSLLTNFNEISANHLIAYENGLITSSAYLEMELAIEKYDYGDIVDQEFIDTIKQISSEKLQNGEVCESLVESLKNNNSYLIDEGANDIKAIITNMQEIVYTGAGNMQHRCEIMDSYIEDLLEVNSQLQEKLIAITDFEQNDIVESINSKLVVISERLKSILSIIDDEINPAFNLINIDEITNIQEENNKRITDTIQTLQQSYSKSLKDIKDYCVSIENLNNEIISENNKISLSNENIGKSREVIFGDMLGIQRQNTTNIITIPILNTTYRNLVYYTELLTWYTEGFLPSVKTLVIAEIPNSLNFYNTDTLEYPTK